MFSPFAEHPPPPEPVDDQRRANVAAVGVDDVAGAAVDLGGLELERALLGQQPAQRPVVERRERPWQVVADRPVRGVDHELPEGLLERAVELQRGEPRGGIPHAEVWRSPIS